MKLMLRVLRCWAMSAQDTDDNLLNRRMRGFPLVAPSQLVKVAPRSPRRELDLVGTYGWLGGRALDKTARPVVPRGTLMAEMSTDGAAVLRCTVRVGLFRLREDTTLHADGWRFEIAEVARPGEDPDDVAHPYQHCQAIVGWHPSCDCLLHAPHEPDEECNGIEETGDDVVDDERSSARDGVNVSHPALPLPTQTLTGLAASVLTTLYGAPVARLMLGSDATLARKATDEIRTDLARLHVLG